MPPTPCPNIVAFVEGDMEQIFLNSNFGNVRVISVSNGSAWQTQALARQVVTFFKAKNYFGWWIVVWVDRERRQENSLEIENVIREELEAAGAEPEKIKIMVADRMTENIILADEKFMQNYFADPDYTYSFCGSGGKRVLSQKYSDIGLNYKETKHGVAALKKIRLFRSAQKCPAVERFITINPLNCWWLSDDNSIEAAY